MRLLVLILLGALSGLSSAGVRAHELDLSFNSDAFRFIYANAVPDRSLRLDAGWLHHSDDGDLVHAGLQLVSNATSGPDPVVAGIGGRLAYLNGERSNQNGLALAVGGSLRAPIRGYNRFAVAGELWYAPDVLIIDDAEEYLELGLRGSYNITRQAEVYVGARYVRAEYKQAADYRFDTGMHLGLNLKF